jgi:hypothetical protein
MARHPEPQEMDTTMPLKHNPVFVIAITSNSEFLSLGGKLNTSSFNMDLRNERWEIISKKVVWQAFGFAMLQIFQEYPLINGGKRKSYR